MRKYINKLMLCILATTLFMSCNDVMDTQPFDKLDSGQAYSSLETFQAVLNQCYADVLGYYSGQYANMEAYTPNGIASDLHNRDDFPTEVGIDANTWNAGQGRFVQLRRLNLVIDNAETSEQLTDASRTEIISTAKFLRGLLYFDMTRKMGRFVPVNEVFQLSDTTKMHINLTKDPAESYTYVMNDINASIDGLPETAITGKITKYAALAYKSRIALQAYAYTNDAKYIDESINAAKEVINSGKYALTSNFENMFLFAGKDDKEIILNRQYLSLNTYVSSFNEMIRAVPNVKNDEVIGSAGSPLLNDPKGRSFEGWAVYFPTQDLVDQYLVIDQQDGMAKPWYQTSQYLNNVEELPVDQLQYNAFTINPDYDGTSATTEYIGYHPVPEREDLGINAKGQKISRYGRVKTNAKINEIMYQNRDKRFYATIVYDSCIWLTNELVTLCVQGNLWAGVRKDKSSSWYTTVSNYYWRKAVANVEPRVYYNNKIDYQFVLIRLGEVYMNLAEAYLLKRDVSKAVAALNETRTKHGGINGSSATSLDEAWIDYIREPRVEMAYEGDLYWSYLRWGKYGGPANYGAAPGSVIQDLNKPVNKIQIKKDRKHFFIGQITVNNAWDRNFTTKRYLYPIPQSFLNNRKAYGIIDAQNPGWE
jgi:hypothetical protein